MGNSLFLVVFVCLIGCTSMAPAARSVATPEGGEDKVALLDFHTHLFFDEFQQQTIENLFTSKEFYVRRGAIVISPSYGAGAGQVNDPVVRQMNKKVSDLLVQNTDRGILYGLCGAYLGDPQLEVEIEACLKQPKMIGVKLHLSGSHTSLSSGSCTHCTPEWRGGYAGKFDAVARLVAKRGGVILTHFTRFDIDREHVLQEDPDGERKERDAFLKSVFKYPGVDFIVAHSGGGMAVETPKVLAALKKNQRPKNLYFETSAYWLQAEIDGEECVYSESPYKKEDCVSEMNRIAEHPRSKALVQAWKDFGIDKILFGTDMPMVGTLANIQFILQNPNLNAQEKEAILFRNGQRLLRKFENDQNSVSN